MLALDLGTTAFKAAAVGPEGVRGKVTVVPYALDYGEGGHVTCNPHLYHDQAMRALRRAARSARQHGLAVRRIALSSQAQTFVPVDEEGRPVGPAIVWTDGRAQREAEEAAERLPDFATTAGFTRPLPVQFLPKVMWLRRAGCRASRYLLLNEWIAWCLTRQPLGDTTNQGMGGFYDISRGGWNAAALALAGIDETYLARAAAPGALSAPLTPANAARIGLEGEVGVFSCGNDQSCAAIGAGADAQGTLFANFGTALVLYGLMADYLPPTDEDEICGISPLPGRWFRLGLESECGNVIEWLARLLYPRGGVRAMLEEALSHEFEGPLPSVRLSAGGMLDLQSLRPATTRDQIARALLEHYAERFGAILARMRRAGACGTHLVAGGGLSRSEAWLAFLGRRFAVRLTPTSCEHPGLMGAAMVAAGWKRSLA